MEPGPAIKVPLVEQEDLDEGNQEVPNEALRPLRNALPISCHSPSRLSSPAVRRERLHEQYCSDDNNWQASKGTVCERNAVMLNNELMADIHFLVGSSLSGPRRMPAHKYVLATGSSVFFAMFYGGLADVKSEVPIPDVEPAAFINLLKYLYCDEISLEADTVLSTLYAAKKYIVPHLARACVRYLETSLSAANACVLLAQSRLFEEDELMKRCWEVIDAQAEEALRSDGFADIDIESVKAVLSRETLNASEHSLFKAAIRWAEAECSRQELEVTPANQRLMLGEALYLLRVPAMTLEQYADSVAQSGLLTLQEAHDVFLHFTASNKPQLPFPVLPRRGLKPQRVHRFQSTAYRSNQWRYRGRCDSIQFAADRRVFIAGFGLYGSSNGASEYRVQIELKRSGVLMGQRNSSFFSDGSSNSFCMFFDNPVQVEPDIYYTASVVLDGGELSYFGQEGLGDITCGGVTFSFQCSSDSTNGTGVQGGQIPELIFYS